MNSNDTMTFEGKTELERLKKENIFLKKQLRMKLNLGGDADIDLLTIDDQVKQEQAADIQMLTQQKQWKAFRRWYMLNAKMLYEQSASAGKDEAYIMVRLAKCLIDMLQTVERINPEMSQPFEKDAFDMDSDEVRLPDTPGGGLPMGQNLDDN